MRRKIVAETSSCDLSEKLDQRLSLMSDCHANR